MVVFSLLAAGCGKKTLTRAQQRAITSEITDAAENITAHKGDITIRTGANSADHVSRPDNIYVSATNASRFAALKKSLEQIAAEHKLRVAESTSGDSSRFDFIYGGVHTQVVHVVAPLAARTPSPKTTGSGSAELAIILDDLGNDRAAADELLALRFPLTFSVLPNLPLSSTIAEEAYRRGDEVMLHFPMESPATGASAENVELRLGMNAEQVNNMLDAMLETVPHAVGINNHQGSRATADATLMNELMPAVHRHALFFIDSRTTAATVAYDAAVRAGVPAASRKVFLDDTQTREAVLDELDLAQKDAQQDGFAIAIGHPHPVTIAVLSEELPKIETRGIKLVFASDLVH